MSLANPYLYAVAAGPRREAARVRRRWSRPAVLVAVVAGVTVSGAGPAAADVIRCQVGEPCVGTERDDTMYGTDGPDRMDGRGGDDVLRGNTSSDFLSGDGGRDQVDGGASGDCVDAGPGDTVTSVEAQSIAPHIACVPLPSPLPNAGLRPNLDGGFLPGGPGQPADLADGWPAYLDAPVLIAPVPQPPAEAAPIAPVLTGVLAHDKPGDGADGAESDPTLVPDVVAGG